MSGWSACTAISASICARVPTLVPVTVTPVEAFVIAETAKAGRTFYHSQIITLKTSGIKTLDDFCEEVMKEDGLAAWRDYSSIEEAKEAIEAVMKTLADYVTAGELHDMIDLMPKEIKQHFMVWVHTP